MPSVLSTALALAYTVPQIMVVITSGTVQVSDRQIVFAKVYNPQWQEMIELTGRQNNKIRKPGGNLLSK